jgi:hypothetical protein
MRRVLAMVLTMFMVAGVVGYLVGWHLSETAWAKHCPDPWDYCDYEVDWCMEWTGQPCNHPQGGTGVWVHWYHAQCDLEPQYCCGYKDSTTCEYPT